MDQTVTSQEDARYTHRVSWLDSVCFWLFTAVSFTLLTAVLIAPRLEVQRKLAQDVRQVRHEVGQLERANARLTLEREAIETDPFYAEEMARVEMGLVRPGELSVPVPQYTHLQEPLPPPLPSRLDWLRPYEQMFARDRFTQVLATFSAVVLQLFSLCFFSGYLVPVFPELAQVYRKRNVLAAGIEDGRARA